MFSIPVGFIDLLEQTAGVQALPCKVHDDSGRKISQPLSYLQYFTVFVDPGVFKLGKCQGLQVLRLH